MPALPIAKGMMEILPMALMWQGKIAKIQVNSRVKFIPLGYLSTQRSPSDLEDTWVFASLGCRSCHMRLLDSIQPGPKPWLCCVVDHLLQLWGKIAHPQLSQCLHILILPPLTMQGPPEHSFTHHGLGTSQAPTWWVIKWVLLAPETTDCKLAQLICISPWMNHQHYPAPPRPPFSKYMIYKAMTS